MRDYFNGYSKNTHYFLLNHGQIVDPRTFFKVETRNSIMRFDMYVRDVCVINGPLADQSLASAKAFDYNPVLLNNFNKIQSNGLDQELQIKNILPVEDEEGKEVNWFDNVQFMNHTMSYAEVCRVMSHMLAWNYSIKTGKTIIVLEAGTVLTEPHEKHLPRNSIISLAAGARPYYRHNENYMCMEGVNAYSIDQHVARRMFGSVIRDGIREPLEYMFRVDQYLIVPGCKTKTLEGDGNTSVVSE